MNGRGPATPQKRDGDGLSLALRPLTLAVHVWARLGSRGGGQGFTTGPSLVEKLGPLPAHGQNCGLGRLRALFLLLGLGLPGALEGWILASSKAPGGPDAWWP